MKLAIIVSVEGTRNRVMPASRRGISVVAASRMLVVAPSVALATTFQAAARPSRDSATPNTSVRSPPPTNGRNTAKATKGRITASRVAT